MLEVLAEEKWISRAVKKWQMQTVTLRENVEKEESFREELWLRAIKTVAAQL